MKIIPSWNDNYDPLTIGDDLHVLHQVTIDSDTPNSGHFSISVQPRSSNGILSEHAQSLGHLIIKTHEATSKFLTPYLSSTIDPEKIGGLRVDLKNILENYRSSLEYVAHYLADRCNPRPEAENVQFPVAKDKDDAISFGRKIDKWFPGLALESPIAKQYLLDIQWFNGELWLKWLAKLSNYNKHRSLSSQQIGRFRSVVIRYGKSAIRLGELGYRSIKIKPGGSFRFRGHDGNDAILDVLGYYDGMTTSILGADPRIEIIPEERDLYFIDNIPTSIAGMVWLIGNNVYRAVNSLCGLLSPPK
ncbi:unnamed protein product [Phaeothamnion confervicola]